MEELIVKYLAGKATGPEEQILMDWINESEDNLKTFSSMQLLWVSQSMPIRRADTSEDNLLFSEIISKQKSDSRGKRIKYWYIAASLTILLAVNAIFLYYNSGKNIIKETVHTFDPDSVKGYNHEVYTEKGVKAFVILPDSSKVWLNSDSKIIFPDKFTGPTREIRLSSGEFFFDVRKNPDTPMVVHTNMNFKVEVTGTTFNIRNYREDKEAQTTLISGSINLIKSSQTGEKEEVTKLSPNDSYIVRKDNTSILIRNPEVTSKQVAWKEGCLIFESTSMEDIIIKLERWHGTKFYIKDPEVLEQKITASFNSESIVQIMEMIKFCSTIDYSVQNNTITLMNKKKK
ncbi:MAG: FecR family protein [Bacteroidales bacterium]|nr:FecR family protein [Bacteroidales bacterium]MDD3989536.1 FecR family protein [Bacteroidales bacterium]